MNFFKYILEYARYQKRLYIKKQYCLSDKSEVMEKDILQYYDCDLLINHDYNKKITQLKKRYKKIHVLRTSICNIGPLCVYYLYLSELLKTMHKDEKILLMFYEVDELLLSEKHDKISNKFIYSRLKSLVDVIDEKNISFWAYAIKNDNTMFDFDWLMVHYQGLLPHEKIYHNDCFLYPENSYISYTLSEENIGQVILQKLNLQEKMYCCIFSRNNEYHEKYFNNTGTSVAKLTQLRNSEVSKFYKAVNILRKNGISSVRVGAVDSRNISKDIIDYTNICRSEFGDFFVMGKAKFVLGDNSGILMIPWLQNVPIGVTNNYTILWMASNEMNYNTRHVFTIYKKWYDMNKRRYLTLKEIMKYQRKYGMTDELQIGFFSSLGIIFHDNTEDEIAELAMEIYLRLVGRWVDEDEFIQLRARFWSIVNEAIKESNKNLCLLDYQPGSLFLQRNKWLLD